MPLFVVNLFRGKKNASTVGINVVYEYCESSSFKVQCSTDPFSDILPNGFLGLLWSFAESIDFFEPFKQQLHVNMKEVVYSNLYRVKALITSIVIGCKNGNDINHKLIPYSSAAQYCHLNQFPEQSSINRFLHRFDLSNISEIDYIFENLLKSHGLWQSQQKIDIDFDCTGLVVYGNTYQFARKGYFPKRRASRGYQLSLATTANVPFKEILSLHLDPGNSHADRRFWDAIYQVASIVGDIDRIGVIRADSASGTGPNIEALLDHHLSFLIKGKNCITAKNFAKKLNNNDWTPINFFVKIADLDKQKIPNCPYQVRTIVVETTSSKGIKKYTHLCTDIDKEPEELFHQYNERQSIKSIIKEDKHGLYISNFRTRKFLGILSFLYFAIICYNLFSLFKYHILNGTGLESMSAT